jgi:SAM-dependent methyltransferase
MIDLSIEETANEFLTPGNDYNFCVRVWNIDSKIYVNRLNAIGFSGMKNVLDAGFGLGQWTLAIASVNDNVEGIEFDENRYNFVTNLFTKQGFNNISLKLGSVEQLPYEDNSFDGIFSYSVILCTDYKKTLEEFYRVLKPGGILYFNTNGLGWYLFNLLKGHNDSADFSSHKMSINAIEASLKYFATGEVTPEACLITPNYVILQDISKIGFENVKFGPEGTLDFHKKNPVSFFKGEYEGHEGVTEYVVQKK